MQLPLTKTLIAVTFFAGLLPVIGNLISNTVIVVVSLAHSPQVARGLTRIPGGDPQAGVLPQRPHRRLADPGPRLGAAAGDARDGGRLRPARAGRRADLLCLCQG
ncbi:MAG: hypothetical protein MZW92_29275 [Comamonadaceae bacterium]|nr:hypothetical protein [Comamonadaceae bacterium]